MRYIAELKITEATSAVTSSVFTNNNCDLCAVQIFGTATAMKIQVQGKTDSQSSTWESIASFNMGDLTLSDGNIGMTTAGIYAVSVAGITQVRINVASVTGGNVSVTAKFADTSAS